MAERFEADAKEAAKRFTALIEPVLIVIMGLVVAAMMMAVMPVSYTHLDVYKRQVGE